MKRQFLKTALAVAGAVLASIPSFAASNKVVAPETQAQLEQKVRHELLMLPYYNIYDDLSFRVEGGKVVLMGAVTRPTLKSDAEGVVKRIAGVTSVENGIEVLPLSSFDNGIRVRVARAVYGQSALNRYAMGALPPIHIIVKNGNVTLEGVVANETDRNIAGIQANSVSGVFQVTNNLRVENKRS
jgi:hyperosmotically inducible protein